VEVEGKSETLKASFEKIKLRGVLGVAFMLKSMVFEVKRMVTDVYKQ
jgi:hypothetical protein